MYESHSPIEIVRGILSKFRNVKFTGKLTLHFHEGYLKKLTREETLKIGVENGQNDPNNA